MIFKIGRKCIEMYWRPNSFATFGTISRIIVKMLISDWLLNFKINLVTLLIGCQRVNSVTLGRPNCVAVWFWCYLYSFILDTVLSGLRNSKCLPESWPILAKLRNKPIWFPTCFLELWTLVCFRYRFAVQPVANLRNSLL